MERSRAIAASVPILILLGITLGSGKGKPDFPPIESVEIPSPAGSGASQPALAARADGTVWLAWLEPSAQGGRALRCAAFDSAGQRWRSPETIAIGVGFAGEVVNRPALAAGENGRMTAAWAALAPGDRSYCLMFSQSNDAGLNWTPPALLSRNSTDGSSPALAILAGGGVLAAWLDQRNRKEDGSGIQLCSRFVGSEGSAAPDQLIDPQACGSCQPTMVALLDGGALVAYLGRGAGPGWIPRLARRRRRQWENPQTIASEPGSGGDVPGGGPRISADGGRLAAAWSARSAAGDRVLVSASPDAGARFLRPVTAGGAGTGSNPAAALLHDGAVLVTWLESAAPGGGQGIRLQRFGPDLRPGPALWLAQLESGRPETAPQTAVFRDYAGNSGTARALVAFIAGGEHAGLHTVAVTVAEGSLLAADDDNCHCAPTPAQLAGYPIRGAITAVAASEGTVTLDLDAAPGVLEAGPQVFLASSGALAVARPGRQCLARIQREGDRWRLFDLRLLEEH